MQQSKEKTAEPSMEDILASIRKIISEEPAGAKPIAAAHPIAAPETAAPKSMPPQRPLTASTPAGAVPLPAAPSNPAPSRLSDIVRELAPTAVPVSSISTASFHDDMADLVEGGPIEETPVAKVAPAPNSVAAPEPAAFRPSMTEPPASKAGSTVLASSKGPAPAASAFEAKAKAAAPTGSQRPAVDFGAFIPSTAESIGMTSPRPAALSMGAEFRSVDPSRNPARAARVEPVTADPVPVPAQALAEPLIEATDRPSDNATDPVAAAQNALGQLAMGFAAQAPEAVPATLAPRPAAVVPDAGAGRKSLDDSIVDMLRPMLRDWLDAHLPEMVEKALRQEMSAERHDND